MGLISDMLNDWIGRIILLCIVVVFVIIGAFICQEVENNSNKIDAGYVVKKEFVPEHTQLVWVGKVLVPQRKADRYTITISDGSKIYYFNVDKNVYNKAKEGQWFNRTEVDKRD